jgi:hypothetical protein
VRPRISAKCAQVSLELPRLYARTSRPERHAANFHSPKRAEIPGRNLTALGAEVPTAARKGPAGEVRRGDRLVVCMAGRAAIAGRSH